MYQAPDEVLNETTVTSEEGQEETFNRPLKPAAPPDSGNGVVVPLCYVMFDEAVAAVRCP